MEQARGAQLGVNHPHHVEGNAVKALNKDGDNRGFAMPDEAGNVLVPVRVRDATFPNLQVGDLTGGENDQQSARSEERKHFPDAFPVRRRGVGVSERVHQDQAIAHGGKTGGQKGVGDGLHVGANAREHFDENQAFQNAEGMVTDDDDRTCFGNAREIGCGYLVIDIQLMAHAGGEFTGTAVSFRLGIKTLQTLGNDEALERAGNG